MDKLSKVKTLYAYEDGDAITPKMGVVIENGYGLQQYYDPNTGEVSQTRFDEHPAILYPLPWSSKQATYLVPQSGQWYYCQWDPGGHAGRIWIYPLCQLSARRE